MTTGTHSNAHRDAAHGDESWSVHWILTSAIKPNKGGQGIVQQVEHRTTRQLGALKQAHKDQSPLQRSRFIGESATLAALDLPGVPRLLDKSADDETDQPWHISEWIEGTQLDDLILPLDPDQALSVSLELAHIVANCHEAGVLHRDIKPENIIRRNTGEIVLVDFGIAVQPNRTGHDLTKPSERMVNAFLDLADLGVGSKDKRNETSDVTMTVGILFFLATGHRPRRLRDAEARPPHYRWDLPTQLRESNEYSVLKRVWDIGFQERMTHRFQDAEELISFLEARIEPEHVDVDTQLGQLSRRLAATPTAEEAAQIQALKKALTGFVSGVQTTVKPHGFSLERSGKDSENTNHSTYVRTLRLMKDGQKGPPCSIHCDVEDGRVTVWFSTGDRDFAKKAEPALIFALYAQDTETQLLTLVEGFVGNAALAWEN